MRLPSKGSASPHNLCQPVGDTAYKGPVLADIGKNTITPPPHPAALTGTGHAHVHTCKPQFRNCSQNWLYKNQVEKIKIFESKKDKIR